MTQEELLKSKEYWLANIQNQLFNHIEDYMKKEGLNRTSLAEKLGVTKGYVSQVLNGDFDHRLSKYIDLLIATNVVPIINFENLDEVIKKESYSLTIEGDSTNIVESYTAMYDSINWDVYTNITGENKSFTITCNTIDQQLQSAV